MFGFIKKNLKKIYNQFSSKVYSLFSKKQIDEGTLDELEKILLEADTGIKTTKELIDYLKQEFQTGTIKEGADLKAALEKKLLEIIRTNEPQQKDTNIYLLVGVNGSGKTTFVAKLANKFKQKGEKTLLVAADTFRAAATEQLEQWAAKVGVEIVTGTENQDPASVLFQACTKYLDENFDKLIIDTAGRLQTKTNLMKELEKIKRIIEKKLPEQSTANLLTVDAMLGQNSSEQAKIFNESTNLDGIILTKMDGTGKGGIIFALKQELNIPVRYISYGEQLDQFEKFDSEKYVKELFEE